MNRNIPPGIPKSPDVDPSAANGKIGADASASEAFHDAGIRLKEIREYLNYYAAVQADALRLFIRTELFTAGLWGVALLGVGAGVVVSVTLLFMGIANGLGAAFGGRAWVGDLIVGVVMLGVVAIAARLGLSLAGRASRLKTVKKYEILKRRQRHRIGRDVKQRAEHVSS